MCIKFKLIVILVFICLLDIESQAQDTRLWSTYFGGSQTEYFTDIASDHNGYVYIVGGTPSDDIVTQNAFQPHSNGGYEGFLAKFSSSGALVWSTYFGGEDAEGIDAVAVDINGNVFVCGRTTSETGIYSNGHQEELDGLSDCFLAKFNSNGARLWSTYFGGEEHEYAWALTTDTLGNVYMAGQTESDVGISYNGHQANNNGGAHDAFIAKFNPYGSLIWSTYYGGNQSDRGYGLAVDSEQNLYLSGATYSTYGIEYNGHQSTFMGVNDAFLAKFTPDGERIWGTYYGGTEMDQGSDLAVDLNDNVLMIGHTRSPTMIAYNGFQNQDSITSFDDQDLFLASFSPSGVLNWATYYGGTDKEAPGSVLVDNEGFIYLSGSSFSNNLIISGGFQDQLNDDENTFIARFNEDGVLQCGTYYGYSHDRIGRIALGQAGSIYIGGIAHGEGSASEFLYFGEFSFGGGYNDSFLSKFSTCEAPFQVETTVSDVNCNGELLGTAMATPIGGMAPYQYSWSTVPTQTTQGITTASAGTYLVTVTDALERVAYDVVTISEPEEFTLVMSSASDCNDGDGMALAWISGGSPPYVHTWEGYGIDNDTLTALTEGWYHFMVSDSANCTLSDSVYVGSGDPVQLSVLTYQQPSCFQSDDGAIAVTASEGTSPYWYEWPVTGHSGSSITGLSAGEHVVNVYDANLCLATQTVVLDQPAQIESSLSHVACEQWQSPSGSYIWNVSGVYTDTVQSVSGCDSVITIDLTLNATSYATILVEACEPHVSPSGNYLWTTSGTHMDTVQSSVGCDSVITVNLSLPQVNYSASVVGNQFTATMLNAEYQWIDCTNGNTPIAGATERTFVASEPGMYACIVSVGVCSDTTNCLRFSTSSVNDLKALGLDIYPNPSTDRLIIDDDNEVLRSVKLYNTLGLQVENYPNRVGRQVVVNVSGLSRGMYLVTLETNKGTLHHRILVN